MLLLVGSGVTTDWQERYVDSQFSSAEHPEYSSTFYGGCQGAGTAWLHRSLERFWTNSTPNSILELGFGSGEHLEFVKVTKPVTYFGLDPAPSLPAPAIFPARIDLRLIKAVAQAVPLPDGSIDRVVATCLLAHVDSATTVCSEIAR